MAERVDARSLLMQAAVLFDAPANGLAESGRSAWRSGFASGGRWMRQALEHLRGRPLAGSTVNLQRLGLFKYGLACAAALGWLALMMFCRRPLLAVLCVPLFYAVEAQMVFLFPLALDGSVRPFREAPGWTRRAGGTVAVLRVVLPLAAIMLLGGFLGRGFVRSWCLGCLAVCLWYEQLRRLPSAESPSTKDRVENNLPFSREPKASARLRLAAKRESYSAAAPKRRRWLLEFGAFRLPRVRHERIFWNLLRPVRLLYASDLHLGHWWTARVAEHLLILARQTSPDLILLGGDLVDQPCALESLRILLRGLTEIAPVHAIAGNHDVRAGLAAVRAAIREAGAYWLPDRAVDHPIRIEAELSSALNPHSSIYPRILCAHAPAVFPDAVKAGYRLVLAGHLHGGQCVLATRRGIQYPAAWFHRWHGLRFRQGDAILLVSRGMADTFPLRFNCPREVLLCEIV